MSRSTPNKSDANFLGRWARRKSQAATEKAGGTVENELPSEHMTVDSDAGATSPESVPEKTDLPAPVPSLETLDEHSDYARFMAKDVTHDLRRLALRKLFKAPVFGIRDGLDDYDEDFTTFEKLGDIVTADMKFHKERLETEAAKEEEERARLALAQTETDDVHESTDSDEATAGTEPQDSVHTEQLAEPSSINPNPALPVADSPAMIVQALPAQRPIEDAPPVLAPQRQRLRLRLEETDDTPEAS
ncbi:MAG: DUF3306 domain-containing protein [Burkholderiaceae bacterium]